MNIKYTIRLDNGVQLDIAGQENIQLNSGDFCVFQKEFNTEYGEVIRIHGPISDEDAKNLPVLIRQATVRDQSTANENLARGRSAVRTAAKYVEQLKLEMNLLNAHYTFDGKGVAIQFTADGRVDFRELVKELSKALACRIELRQIGVRDETAICGGIGICGQVLCCARFLTDFASVNVKMAKEQDLSLTPSTISGACGRLKCCLRYEHAGYLEMEKTMPSRGEYCECAKGRGRVVDRNLLTQKVTLQLEDSAVCCVCDRSEIKIIPPGNRKKEQKNSGSADKGSHNSEKRRNGGK